MKLLVSVVDEEEALEALEGGADIIDVKNPREGSLGANFPWIIKQIEKIVRTKAEVSATLGDLPNIPGTASLAASGAASLGLSYIKVGLLGTKTAEEAIYMMRCVQRSVKETSPSTKIIASGYADYNQIDSFDPIRLPDVAHGSLAEGVLIDIKNKGEKNLFDLIRFDQLRVLVNECHRLGLMVAFAGSLGKKDISKAWKLGADIIGMRGSVCDGVDRIHGRVKKELVSEVAEIIGSLNLTPTSSLHLQTPV